MKEPLQGKKTYVVAVITVLLGLYQVLGPRVGLPALDLERELSDTLGFITMLLGTAEATIRLAIRKLEKVLEVWRTSE